MNGEDFQMREIQQEPIPIQPTPPEKKGGGLISLFNKKNFPKTLIVILILVILMAVGAILWGRHSFSRAKVQFDVKVPENIASGEEVSFKVDYQNNNRVALYDASLIIDYPQGTFSPEGKEVFQEQRNIGTILSKSAGEEEFKVRFVGEEGSAKNLIIKLNYQPQNISSRFENSSSFGIEINSVLIDIKISGSEKTVVAQEVNYLIEYENKTEEDISDLKIEMDYVDDFEFKNANPAPTEATNNAWQLASFKAGEKKSIALGGILNGKEGEEKILKVKIGRMEDDVFIQYSQSEFITQISPSPLLILLTIEDIEEECNLNPGQTLHYQIDFKNNTDIALNELVLKAYFQDNVFDFKTLDLGGKGFFDSQKNIITWSGAEVSSLNLLQPNQEDKVSFSMKIKDALPIFKYNDKNFQAKVRAEIQTLSVPAKFAISELKFEKELVCKINSELDLEDKVYYYEPKPGIFNTGPIPPKVDQLTTYTAHWQLANTSNDLENVQVKAILPQGINWSNYYTNSVSNSTVSYNDRTNEVVWEIKKVPAGTGVVLPIYELIFQIGLRPSLTQVGQTPTLINETSVEGKDTFTGVTLKAFTPEVDSSLPDDPKMGYGQGKVVE
jgi:hypothetical protein